MDTISITSIDNLKKRKKLNLYLNDNNKYVINAIKMRKKHLSIINDKMNLSKEFKKKYPIPKSLLSTSDFNFKAAKKRIFDQFNIKNSVQDLVDIVNIFTDTLNLDDLDIDNKPEKLEQDASISSIEYKNKKSETVRIDRKNKLIKDFFITNKCEKETETENEYNKIKPKKINFKNNLYFENYGKFKFTKQGVLYPKRLKKFELPKYEGNDKEEKKYFDYRKKIYFPEKEYNKISNFGEKFNKDLGKISNNYATYNSRTRFTDNPILNKYRKIIPIYDIYKDLKEIENRYIGTKYKFKLLPLYNKRITNLDKLADKFYKTQYSKEGLMNLLKIQTKKFK